MLPHPASIDSFIPAIKMDHVFKGLNLMLNEIFSCEVCGEKKLYPVLDLGLHPMCDDLVPIGESRICKTFPIEILFCTTCITAHQRFQIPKRDLFPISYHYRSRHTTDVLNGMRSLVESCEKYRLAKKKVLDIGCNDGSLLTFFAEKKAETYGVEPTGAYEDAIKAGHRVTHDFFCPRVAKDIAEQHGQFDIIVFTNVFAHIENLSELINSLKIVMHKESVVIIENHYLGAILEKFQFDTFYHEHPRTYSYTSFTYIAKLMDRKIGNVEFPSRYNGNIRLEFVPDEKKSKQTAWDKIHEYEKSFESRIVTMQQNLNSWCQTTNAYLTSQFEAYGKLTAKAFPGRAAILIKLLQLDEHQIEAVYEKPGSCKINHYVPGTRIPILSDAFFNLRKDSSPLINFAWHISREIHHYMRQLGYTGPIVDIISDT